MSGDTRITGAITIDPPLTWAQVRDSVWLSTKENDDRNWSGPGNYREVLLRVVDSARDTDSGIVVDRIVNEIVPVLGEISGYYVVEQIQRIVGDIGSGHTFGGHLECTWRGSSPETWRIAVRDGQVVELRPEVRWPDETPVPQYEPSVDAHGDALWLTDHGMVDWLSADETAPEGWRRLYVQPAPDGGAS